MEICGVSNLWPPHWGLRSLYADRGAAVVADSPLVDWASRQFDQSPNRGAPDPSRFARDYFRAIR